MALTTTPYFPYDIYPGQENIMGKNRLFCTFVEEQQIDSFIDYIKDNFGILYNKVFVLEIKKTNQFVCTYNVDQNPQNIIPENTVLVHRKKEHNTLYTINALNELIRELNGGIVDPKYMVPWQQYRNTLLLTQQGEFKSLGTKIYKIVEL